MKRITLLLTALLLLGTASCNDDLLDFEQGDLDIKVEKGDEWFHDFPVFLGITHKNTPQIAIWLEDTTGNYLSTIYVTAKTATQGWYGAGSNRRKESLPHWAHQRGVQYSDGLYCPTEDDPLPDGMTGATPTGNFDVRVRPQAQSLKCFRIKVEVNHSTDFNDAYPKWAKYGDDNYSGGREGSGQPAVVYMADVDLNSGQDYFTAKLVGHSSPDGKDGEIYTDLNGLTTALHIVKRISVRIR